MTPSLLLSLILTASSPAVQADSLLSSFQHPSRAAKPYVWWHWMDGEVSLDGIRKDLEWMDAMGIAGFHQFDAGGVNMPKAAAVKRPYLSDSWKEAYRYAIFLADSLGMEATVASAPGWSSTGGPWVSPQDAMKKLEWKSVDVRGGAIDIVLPELGKVTGQYQDLPAPPEHIQVEDYGYDVALIAVKLPEGDVSMDALGADLKLVKAITVKGTAGGFRPREGNIYTDNELQCSQDGKRWKTVCRIPKSPLEYVTLNIPPTKARYFRVTGEGIQDLQLHGVRKIERFQEKAGYCFPYDFNQYPTEQVDNEKCIRPQDVVILTDRMGPDGRLQCSLPNGNWRIYRFGASLTGKMNHPASPNATGLEVDKLDKKAWSRYFHTYLDMYKEAAGGMLGPKGVTHILVDSYEAKSETWSACLPEEFQKRRGYDLIPWLPVLAGEIIGDARTSERFLFDWRKTLGELFTENYARIGDFVQEYGMKGTYIESHESGRAFVGDGMDAKRAATVPMAAIWMTDSPSGSMLPSSIIDIRESASVAHIYGQNIAAAESFTVNGENKKAYTYHPANIKPIADMALASGLNRFVIHDSASQPSDDYLPGLGLFKYGQWFHRNETWAAYARVWTDYLSRSCQMMQSGRNVADILLFYGEDTNATAAYGGEHFKFLPTLPSGFNFDLASPDVLLNQVRIENGALVTNSGQRYSALMIGRHAQVISDEMKARIAEIRAAGVCVLEENDPFPSTLQPDVVLPEGMTPEHLFGDGVGIPQNERGHDASLMGIQSVHREIPEKGVNIYWLSNFTGKKQSGTVKFRTVARYAALFNPETGEAFALDCADAGNGYTALQFSLLPGEALFYVLTDTPLNVPAAKQPGNLQSAQILDRYWDVEFVQKGGESAVETFSVLNDWTTNSDPVVKYFSGTAHYSTTFTVGSLEGLDEARIDLGEVKVMAELFVNGHPAGVLWHAPFVSADILPFLQEGENKLEVNVTNLWVNRMIGDRQRNAKPVTQVRRFYEAGDKLQPSGLLGPVRLLTYQPQTPRIVNIINFIRLTEPRSEEITNQVLFETVRSQAEDLRSKGLIGTYLLQFDALMDPSYQALMKEEMARGCEVGAWWEITQPHVEAAGYTWRGRYPWDWHAHVGFSVGYTQAERERLVDVYMEQFKAIFGQYPKSVGSWFIEAGTLAYLRDRYGIEASCSCRDQVGTDGYTLWGGYWNGGYYPSRQNAYMPAQTAEGAIDVPIFRMLGSDPIYQYEAGVGGAVQSVVTLEPVYELGGGSPEWVDWFFRMFTREPHMGYNYVQVGQENSFTWEAMEKGFVYQTGRLAQMQQKGEVRIETLAQTGRWFKANYPVTPPTSVITTEDTQGNARKTLWFNSRNYRANLLWEGSALKIRDVHVFDQQLRSEYLDRPDTLPIFHYEALPLVDGCLWSQADQMAGLNLVAPDFKGDDPLFSATDKEQVIRWPSAQGEFIFSFTEDGFSICTKGRVGKWYLELSTAPGAQLPFTSLSNQAIQAHYLGRDYGLKLEKGHVQDLRSEGGASVLRLLPADNQLVLKIGDGQK